LSEELGTKVS